MRRPNLKWLLKCVCLLLLTGSLFFMVISWISASPYTNRLVQPDARPMREHKLPQAGGAVGERENGPAEKLVQRPANEEPQQAQPPQAKDVDDDLGNDDDIDGGAIANGIDNDFGDNNGNDDKGDKVVGGGAGAIEANVIQPKEPIQAPQPQLPVDADDDVQLIAPSNSVRDWHDYTAMERDAQRVGIGEQGKRATIDDESQRDLERRMSLENGFNALLSDSISVNRSLPDIRNEGCRYKKYLGKLPTVSVVIPYFNEHFSVLMRSVHSLVNRSPRELLKEIILVDDHSDREYLFKQLDQYVAQNFDNVQIVRLTKRTGLIGARVAGARKATQEVLIFLDSHIEANYNWLPPLLEPIAKNKRTAVCPFIDVIDHSSFQYRAQDEGARGAFDWEFYYKRLPLLPEDLKDRSKPFKSPVMAGGLFAISTEFFWELGGYDEGLDIWGGEQYELSFKIWMCGGEMYDAPCSRVGHIYRGPRNSLPNPRKGDYLHKNYKRVAEVWMDEYKNYLYEHADGIYEIIDAGDLTEQKAIRKKLHCKSFKWFMEEVAFDLVKHYPPVTPPDYANGAIQNVGEPTLCVDTLSRSRHSEIGLYPCASNLKRPQHNQNWALSWHRDLRLRRKNDCLDVQQHDADAPVWLWDCHTQGGNQYWYYDRTNEWLVHGEHTKRCMEAVPDKRKLVVNKCDEDNVYMRWRFGNVNGTALDRFNLKDD